MENRLFTEFKNGEFAFITETDFNKRIAKYKLHIKKHADLWRVQGFKFVLISTATQNTATIYIKGFKTKIELDFFVGDNIANIVYL